MGDYNNHNQAPSFSAGILIGALVGGVVALLTSPKTGEGNRKTMKEAMEQMQKRMHKMKGELGNGMPSFQLISDVKGRLQDMRSRNEQVDDRAFRHTLDDSISEWQKKNEESNKHKLDQMRKEILSKERDIMRGVRDMKNEAERVTGL
ncbi:hypothetical protein HGA88_02350 [Candidatus Roizmanbacteria bacterium]|nr:hypothetical protein [Candidatus Roizmanbacteria bacterium]